MAITTLNLRGLNRSDTATSGQVVTATSAVAMDFQSASADLVKLNETLVTSSTASIDWVHGTGGVVLDSTYKHYCVVIHAVPVTNGGAGAFRLSDDTGTSFETSGYLMDSFRSYYSGGSDRHGSTAYIILARGSVTNTLASGIFGGTFWFHGMTDSTVLTAANGTATQAQQDATQIHNTFSSGHVTTVNNHDGIQFLFDNGNILDATATLYGLK